MPIVIDKNNEIVAGHTRYKASKKLGLEKIPCIIADDLNEEQIKAFRLADNKVGEIAEWDFDLLNMELESISFDMSSFGFNILNEEEKEVEEDDYDLEEKLESIEEPKSKIGDIYQLGNHRLMCGDSTKIEDVQKLIDGNKIELVLTDPPYNMGYSGAGIIKETTKNVRERIKDIINFDAHSISYLARMDVGSVYIFTSKDLIPEYRMVSEVLNI